MSDSKPAAQGLSRLRSPIVLIPIAGMTWIELVYLSFTAFFIATTGTVPFFVFYWSPFMMLMPIAILVIWKRPRIGYILAAIVAGLGLACFSDGGFGVEVWATPSSTAQFFEVITDLPAYFAVLLYAVFGVVKTRAKQTTPPLKPLKTLPRYTTAGLLIVGFVIGGLVVGLLAGATESRLLQNGTGDIVIVSGAASQSNGQFYNPTIFQTRVGRTVTWANRDSQAHTLTSDSGVFDSANIAVGAFYTYTFNQAGNFSYHCTYHLWMKGTVTVQP